MTARPNTAGRDEGMNRAVDHADMRVVAAIDAAIDRANASGQPWSANTIRAQFPTTESKGLVGARVRAAAARRPRVMVKVGTEPSDLESTHAHEIKRWQGAWVFEAVAS